MYQSIPAVKIPLGNFLSGQNPHFPGKELGCKTLALGAKTHVWKSSAPSPLPLGRTRLKKLIKNTCSKGTSIYLLKLGISIKQNHLLKLKYSLHMSETVLRVVVLISINTCIAVVCQIYSLKLRDLYLKMAENVLSSNYRAQAEWYW